MVQVQPTAVVGVTQFAILQVNRNLANEAFRPAHVEEAVLETEYAPLPVYAVQSGDTAEAVLLIALARRSPVGEGSLAAGNAQILPFVAHRMATVGLGLLTVARPPHLTAVPLANQRSVRPVGRLLRLSK